MISTQVVSSRDLSDTHMHTNTCLTIEKLFDLAKIESIVDI